MEHKINTGHNYPKEGIVNYFEYKGVNHRFTFYDGDDANMFIPYKQSYGICVTEEGDAVIGKMPSNFPGYLLPGGRIEKAETPEQTLIREADEELSIDITHIKLLGAQKVEFLNIDKEPHYELRYFAIVKTVNALTADPDNRLLWERRLVPIQELNKHLCWGTIGDHLQQLAYKEFLKIKKS